MLQALNEFGQRIVPALMNKEKLSVLKNTSQYFCPTCKMRVILKIGRKVTPHFAHVSNTNCLGNHNGESPYHEAGKLLLYQWLKSLQLDVELERYIPDIGRQPDLFVTINDKKVAIEYQCARIGFDELKARMNDYKSAQIEQIWILGGNRFERIGYHHYKLDAYTQMFMHHFRNLDPVLYYFCSSTLNFMKLHNIYLTSTSRAIAQMTIKKITELHLLDLFHIPRNCPETILTDWTREKRVFRLRQTKRYYSDELYWRQWLYLNQLHSETLPSFIFLPISGQYKMRTNLWNWQSRLYFNFFHSNNKAQTFTLKQCRKLLRSHMKNNDSYLHIQEHDPIEEYLNLLTMIGVLTKNEKGFYQLKCQINIYKNVEEAITGDEIFIQKAIVNLKQYESESKQIVSMKAPNSDILRVDKI